jgi:hypothetical protein
MTRPRAFLALLALFVPAGCHLNVPDSAFDDIFLPMVASGRYFHSELPPVRLDHDGVSTYSAGPFRIDHVTLVLRDHGGVRAGAGTMVAVRVLDARGRVLAEGLGELGVEWQEWSTSVGADTRLAGPVQGECLEEKLDLLAGPRVATARSARGDGDVAYTWTDYGMQSLLDFRVPLNEPLSVEVEVACATPGSSAEVVPTVLSVVTCR